MSSHSKIGVWDLYEDTAPSQKVIKYSFELESLPYVWRMIKDVASIPSCWHLLSAYLFVDFLASIVPAIALSYSGQLLHIVQTAIDSRTVDAHLLVTAVAGGFVSALATRVLRYAKQRISSPLHLRIKLHYSVHIFHAIGRLDVPTFDDPVVQRQLEQSFPQHSHSSIPFAAVSSCLHVITTAIQLTSQLSVLVSVLRDQPDGPLLAVLCFSLAFFQWSKTHKPFISNGAWAATTTDKDYIKSEGLKRAINNPIHRKEIVAGGIAPYLLSQYRDAVSRISNRAGDFYEAVASDSRSREAFSSSILFHELLRALPEIVFTLRAVRQPASIPLSLASLHLITQTTQSFTYTAFALVDETGAITERLAAVRHLYQVATIPNRVKVQQQPGAANRVSPPADFDADEDEDAKIGVPFPEDDMTLESGISVEFRDVSFRYPGSDAYALRHTNFKIERGQLCVIVGNNGSGKSTILKLIARLYDPSEGQILIDGLDIKTLRLADLRRAISVLFQDYTHFPLSIRDNIALGDPPHAHDLAKIEEAARLGGAAALIAALPAGYETYLERPVQDYYSSASMADGTARSLLAGKAGEKEQEDDTGVEPTRNGGASGGGGAGNRGVSGGQMQRIALSRTFMRSVVSDHCVGLLLFDEPSASLDPTAEHDLFERLRKLRGNKTMVFSSHRFGNLTRHADLILYMNDSVVLEEGTHDQLLKRNGEYARIWMLQARAFL